MNTKNPFRKSVYGKIASRKIVAILMAGIVALAVGMPMAIGSVTTSATVGNAQPDVSAVSVTDPASMALCPAKTQISVTATVTDANGVGDINTVKVNISGGLLAATDMNCTQINPTTLSCELNIDLDCCTGAGDYTVTVTAIDKGTTPLSNSDTDTLTVPPSKGLGLNFDTVTFAGAPGATDRPGSAYLDASLVATPEVESQGNAVTDVGVLAINLTKAGEPDIDGNNMEANIKNLGMVTVKPEHTFDTDLGCTNTASAIFQLDIPAGAAHGDYTGDLTITAK